MIPKIIHYCWFGGKKKPVEALKCIQSWRKYLKDYQIIEWNEQNFDINQNQYVKEAYESKKYAFVTDFVRLFALKEYGGIYMDTDVEVLKPFNQFLHHEAFSGFENNNFIPTGIMGSQKGGQWVSELLDMYKDKQFILPSGKFDTTTNTVLITNHMLKKGLIKNNIFQDFKNYVTLYPSDYFCPKDHATGLIKITENTVCIHHFAASWLPHNTLRWKKHQLKLFIFKVLAYARDKINK